MIVVMQIWDGDKELAVMTAKAVKEDYPDCQLGILANNCVHPKELEDYADLIHATTEDIYHEQSGGLATHELLVLGLRLSGRVIIKIDPNTDIALEEGLEDELCRRNGVFGQLRTIQLQDQPLVRSSIFAVSRLSARELVDSCVLLDSAIQNPSKGSQSLLRRYFNPKKGLSSHDWPIAYASSVLGISHNYSGKLLKAFRHEPRENKYPIIFNKSGLALPPSVTDLRSEILAESPEHVGLNEAIEFISMIWGGEGVSISMKHDPNVSYYVGDSVDSDGVLHHSVPKINDIAEAKKVLKEGAFSFKIMNAKPENGDGVYMLVLDVDRRIKDCDASVVSTSFDHSQIFFMMKDPLSKESAEALIKEASFADRKGSRLSTFLNGVRIPGTASYEDICLHNTTEDRCTSHKVLGDGKVRLVKFVDLYFTYDEALAVIRGLVESYKVRPPATEPEPALP